MPLSSFMLIKNLVYVRIVSHQTVLYRVNYLLSSRKFYFTFLIIFQSGICQTQYGYQYTNPLYHSSSPCQYPLLVHRVFIDRIHHDLQRILNPYAATLCVKSPRPALMQSLMHQGLMAIQSSSLESSHPAPLTILLVAITLVLGVALTQSLYPLSST